MSYAFDFVGSNYSCGGVLRRIIHLILTISIGLSHWSLAYAGQPRPVEVPVEIENRINELTNRSSNNSVIVEGPFVKDTSFQTVSLSAPEGRIRIRALEEERLAQGISSTGFFEFTKGLKTTEKWEAIVDTEKYPNFFNNVEKRYQQYINEYYQERARDKQAERAVRAEQSSSEKKKANQMLIMRAGTSVLLISMMVSPSNFAAVTIAAATFFGTYIYNNKMAWVESVMRDGAKGLIAVPRLMIPLGARTLNKMPFLNLNFTEESIKFGKTFYDTHIGNKNFTKTSMEMVMVGVISLMITSVYTIGINIGELGFAKTALASGTFLETPNFLSEGGKWSFLHGFNWASFTEAIKLDWANFSFTEAWMNSVKNHDLLLKTGILTVAFESWTVARNRLRGIYADPTKVNAIGRYLGLVFAIMGPTVQATAGIFKGEASHPLHWAGAIAVGALAAGGLAYIYGDTKQIHDRVLGIISASKKAVNNGFRTARDGSVNAINAAQRASYNAGQNIQRTTKAATAAGYMQFVSLTHAVSEVYRSVPRRLQMEAPVVVLSNYIKTQRDLKFSCRNSFK